MKKIFEKHGVLRCIAAFMDIVALILFIVAAFVDGETADMVLKFIGILLYTIGSMMLVFTGKDHYLSKSILVFVSSALILSWLYPSGVFQGTDFSVQDFSRIGLADMGFVLYYALQSIMDKIIFLVVVAGFYGVLSKVSGYQKLVGKLADKCSNHPIVTSVITSVILFLLTTLFTPSFAMILFLPFLIRVLTKMGMDKLTSFVITFGSVLVGILGCTYGTDSLTIFNKYMGQETTYAINYRYIIAAVSIVLYNFFIVMRVRKISKDMKKNAKANNVLDDPFKVEKLSGKEKTSLVPAIIVLAITVIMVVLGYINWNGYFKIEIFDKFHEWLIGLEAGEDFTIFSYILGNNANALGSFKYTFSISMLLIIASVVIAFLYKMKTNEYIESFYEGTKNMFKPMLLLLAAGMLFGIANLCLAPLSICNWLINLTKGFNPYLTSVVAFITSLFQTDLGYVAYTCGSFFTQAFSGNVEIIHTIFTSMYGLVQVFMPTSAILIVGLSMMKIEYKDWVKYIWLFALGMLVILLVLFTVVTYI